MHKLKTLLKSFGRLYSAELGIDLKNPKGRFKWFLAAILFGKPIQESVAAKTYKAFERAHLTSPRAILKAGWNKLVDVLDSGGYVRYDFSTATKLLDISKKLLEEYGSLEKIHATASGPRDLEKRLLGFKGIGPVTINIFLRELRGIWKKADPEPCAAVKKAAKLLGINLKRFKRKSRRFALLECALYRLAKQRNFKTEGLD